MSRIFTLRLRPFDSGGALKHSRLATSAACRGRIDELDGFVVLYGPIADIGTKEGMARMAGGVKGVRKVNNNLNIVRS